MGKSITISKEELQHWMNIVTDFFYRLRPDELGAVIAVGVGLLLIIIALFLF